MPLNTMWSSLACRCVGEGQLVIVIRPDVIKRPITMQVSMAQSKVPKEGKDLVLLSRRDTSFSALIH